MKTRITLKQIAVIVSLAIALTLIGVRVKAQDKPAAVIPAPFKLSLGATKEYIALEQQKAAIIKAFNDLNEKERLLMIDIPEAARSNCKVDGEQIACSVPLPSPSPK